MIKEVSFNKEVASIVGVKKAIIVHYLAFCIEKNKSNHYNFNGDRYWTYNSHESILKIFPFLKNRLAVKRAIDSLVNDNHLLQSKEAAPKRNLGYAYALNGKIADIYSQKSEVKINEKVEKPKTDLTEVVEILEYFNIVREKLGYRGYKLDKISKSHSTLILSRLKDGATIDEMKRVIDMKEKEWLNDAKMKKYLRVETLFNKTKYDMYVSELPKETKKDNDEVSKIKRILNIKYGMRGLRNEDSDKLAKQLISLGYEDMEYLKQYLI